MSTTVKNIPSHQRKDFKQLVKAGKYTLHIVGSQDDGFTLAGQRGEHLIRLSRSYPTRAEAIDIGQKRYRQAAAEA